MVNRNKVEYKIFGIRRSGMHALVYWITKHYDKPVWFANDLASFNNPTRHRTEYEPTYEPEEYISPLDVDDFWSVNKDVLFSTYEDISLNSLNWDENSKVIGQSDKYSSLLVIRDPFNLFASRFKKGMVLDDISKQKWKGHAKEALGETSYLKNKVIVNYNKWFLEEEYRRKLETELGLCVSDEGLSKVYGLGSSFTGNKRDGDAKSMKVLDRWRLFQDNKDYMDFFDSEMVRLSWALFGSVPSLFMERVL